MPNRIHLLEETVANRIAAGEVIERPASVIKELIDNALDAGATRIDVEAQRGGKGWMRVSDDGSGMSYDDALLCLERHATSKIRSAEDLLSIGSFGFRGEALPSIASVSRFRLLTREPAALVGTEIVVDGGKLISVKEAGCAPGTAVEVRSLFLHTPGRRKFLRSDDTEKAHVEQVLRLAVLARPEVGFSLSLDDQALQHYPATADLAERLRQVFGRNWMEHMLPLEAEEGRMRLRGFIGQPGVSRGNRQEHHLFVNGRPVQSPTLNYAVLEGYHNALMRGRFPVLVLFFDLDPARVDVNVHPAKREVRFRDDMAVRSFIMEAVRNTLRSRTQQALEVPLGSATVRNPSTVSQDAAPMPTASSEAGAAWSGLPSPQLQARENLPRQSALFGGVEPEAKLLTSVRWQETERELTLPDERNHDLKILGLMLGLYVVAEGPNGIVLIDQHAAHERVLFEQMLERVAREEVVSQRLLVPVTVELPPEQTDFVAQNVEELQAVGLGVASLGGNTFIIDGLPPMIKTQHIEDFFRSMVVDLMESGGETRRQRKLSEEIVAKTVCRHAVKANDILGRAELEKLIIDLHKCDLPYTCPHGRPTMILLSRDELEKKFGRAV
ncbi:MAG: DNA mismatch repair endonuclease MutL [Blastochloris sp.]|nr:DNA mismatch repair endonuclease MutL [Blastochloris sp.]